MGCEAVTLPLYGTVTRCPRECVCAADGSVCVQLMGWWWEGRQTQPRALSRGSYLSMDAEIRTPGREVTRTGTTGEYFPFLVVVRP